MKYRTKKNHLGYDKFGGNDLAPNHNSDYHAIKSGILTQAFSKRFKEEELNFKFFSDETIHSNDFLDIQDVFYHDDKTINYTEKFFTPTLSLDSKYVNNEFTSEVSFYNKNKLLSTPNVAPFYEIITDHTAIRFESEQTTKDSADYDRILKEDFVNSTYETFIESDYTLEKTRENVFQIENSYNVINIDYDLNKSSTPKIRLSYSKNAEARELTFPDGSSFNCFNGNTVYLKNPQENNDQSPCFDYLGNVGYDYYSSFEDFLSQGTVCFNNLSQTYMKSLHDDGENSEVGVYGLGGIPVHNFGFPFDVKFTASKKHEIKIDNFITKPFVVEKVLLDFNMSNWSQSIDIDVPCLNFVSFFLLNQRKSINHNSLKDTITSRRRLSVDAGFEGTYEYNISYGGSVTYTEPVDRFYTITEIQELALDQGDNSFLQKLPVDIPAQRDLISVVTVANYSNSRDNFDINLQKIKENADVFVDLSDVDNIGNTQECIYQNKNFEIISNVKSFYENKDMPIFTSFNLFPEKPDSTRTNLDVTSNRETSGEKVNNIGTKTLYSSLYNYNINVYDQDYKESGYVLKPGDNLTLGISLTPSLDINDDDLIENGNLYGRDLVEIFGKNNKPIKLKLFGYYLEDKEKKVIINKKIKDFKNSRKIGYHQNEIVDQLGSDYAYLEKNYYDRTTSAKSGQVIANNINSSINRTKLGNKFELPNLNVSSAKLTDNLLDNIQIFYNGLEFKKDYFKLQEGDDYVYLLKQYFNKYRFGMFADRLNHNQIYQFEDSSYKNIEKRFMLGYYKQKSPAKVVGKVNFDFEGIHEYTGKNFLTEKIFVDSFIQTFDIVVDEETVEHSVEISELSIDIKDHKGKSVTVKFRIPILTDDANDKGVFSYIPSGFNEDNSIFYHNFEESTLVKFENKNYNTTITTALYEDRVGRRVRVMKEVISLIKAMILSLNVSVFDKKPLSITASLEDNAVREKVSINFVLSESGKLGEANIFAGEEGSNVTYENFAIEEGDLLNSYNTNKNAYYSDESIKFKED